MYLCVFSIIFEIVYYTNDPKHFIPVFIIFAFQMNIKIKFINTQCKIIRYDLTQLHAADHKLYGQEWVLSLYIVIYNIFSCVTHACIWFIATTLMKFGETTGTLI